MTQHELAQFGILFLSWVLGAGGYYLYLINNDGETKFKNVKNSFFLSLAFGVAGSFAGAKANVSFWVVWLAFAVGGAIVTNQMLKKKSTPIPGVYGKSASGVTTDKEDVLTGLRNVGFILLSFGGIVLIGTSSVAWLLFLYGPVVYGAAGWLYSKGNKLAALRWAIIGLLACGGFYLAI